MGGRMFVMPDFRHRKQSPRCHYSSRVLLNMLITSMFCGNGTGVIGVLHDGRCGQVILSRYQWTGGVLQAVGDASAETPAYLVGPGLVCQRYVTIHGAMVLPLLPEAIRLVTTAVAAIEARCLLAVCGDEWPVAGALATASMEPVYVRPAVFVAPRPPVGLGRD